MKEKKLWTAVVLLASLVAVIVFIQGWKQDSAKQPHAPANEARTESASESTKNPPMNMDARQVPAHYEVPPSLGDLRPVLSASQFVGKTREAYDAVKQIPSTIAQMPCYCHCDRGMGHKSLHSCFEDDHAAHCATCVDEALMACRLQKEGLSAPQIRERIIAEFSEQ